MTHYIGKKGYTILKSSLTEDVLNKTKSELWLKPQMPGKQFAQNQVQAFLCSAKMIKTLCSAVLW